MKRKCPTCTKTLFYASKSSAYRSVKNNLSCRSCARKRIRVRYTTRGRITKRCSGCKETKSVLDYHKNRSRNDGYNHRCKKCESLRSKFNIHRRLSKNIRTRLYTAIKNQQKVGSAIKDLGCSIKELKIYLELKFQPEMTWNNYGFYGWHIDHIIPLANFDLTNREQFLKACHYTNLQPLWAADNQQKGSR